MKIITYEYSKDRFLFFCKERLNKLVSENDDLKESSEIVELDIKYDTSNKPCLHVKTDAEISVILSIVKSELSELSAQKEDSIEIRDELKKELLKSQDIIEVLNDCLETRNSAINNAKKTGIDTIYDMVPYIKSISCVLTLLLKIPISPVFAKEILENLLNDYMNLKSNMESD